MSLRPELKLDWATHKAAKYAVENWHYSESMPSGKIVKIGVWENKTFIGVVLFSSGANNVLGKPYGLGQTECCELTRIALTNHLTPVSRIIKISFNFLRKSNPGLRLIISFADTDQGHHGGVYQATNWIYNGKTNSADEYIVFGKRLHGRSMRAKYGTHIGKNFIKIIKGSSKHRYLMPLDKEMAKQINLLAKPYPKREKQAMDTFQVSQRRGSTDLHAPPISPI
jgi:hypothetical protein|tara:strand:- start:91 stop:765 length:675 start_codon:yes stop_codon:yes gene_type:complete